MPSDSGIAMQQAQAEWLAGRPQAASALTRFGERALFREGWYRVGRNSYAWMVPNGSWGETNIGLIECNGQSVLVDTCWDVKFTEEMLRFADAIVRRSPIEYVINTHSDGDHCWGNQLFADKTIIASQACVRQMRHTQPGSLQALKMGARVMRRLPLFSLHRFGHYMSQMFQPYDFTGLRILEPGEAFRGEKVITVKGVEIVITEVGPGHTDGDSIVFVPSERVVYAGDILFVGVTPVMWSGPVEQLVAGLKRLLTLEADVIVPGHGSLATRADVQSVIDYWDFLQTALHRCFRIGMPLLRAARDVVLSPSFRTSPFAHWDSPERIVSNAHTLYRYWGASVASPPGKLGMMNLMRQQAGLAFELPEATPRAMRHF
ncbi:MAG TPA: MBL fold metallo-hydrolase [Terriglobia bacterium]|nr:MBL fold metallo-hydrolase [Terriglobia bacterium]